MVGDLLTRASGELLVKPRLRTPRSWISSRAPVFRFVQRAMKGSVFPSVTRKRAADLPWGQESATVVPYGGQSLNQVFAFTDRLGLNPRG